MASRYYVHAGKVTRVGDFESEVTWGPYPLPNAKAFARIGSAKGKWARAITRGRDGEVVRVYKKGKRTYPPETKRVQKDKATPKVGDIIESREAGGLPAVRRVYEVKRVGGVTQLGLKMGREVTVLPLTADVTKRLHRTGVRAAKRDGTLKQVSVFALSPPEENPARLDPLHERFPATPGLIYAVRHGDTVLGTITKIGQGAYRASVLGAGRTRDFTGLDQAGEWVEEKAAQQRIGRRGR